MSPKPWTIAPEASMAEAHRVMREHGIRHLPVVQAGQVAGVVSVRDLHLLETLPGVVAEEVSVEDAMSSDVFTASSKDELADVVERMADQKLGCVVVTGPDGVEGIFTAVDALRALADLLRREAA